MIKQILILMLTSVTALAGPDLPNRKLTPGAFRNVTSKQICTKAFHTSDVRNVPESERRMVFKEYRIDWNDRAFYECDHLCSLEIGGSNNIRNLFPEPWHINVKGEDRGAKVKDVLENRLKKIVCNGTITLDAAQAAITINWEKTYLQFIGPFPKYRGTKQIADMHWVEKP